MADDDPFDDTRLTAMGLFLEAHEGLTAKTSPVFTAHGLSFVDFDTLIRLARSPGARLRMSDLAAQTSLSTSGMTRVVDRLERLGLLCRAACPGDRRGLLAVLTDTGSARLRLVLPGLLAAVDRWFTGLLEPAQLDAMLEALRVVRDSVRPEADAGSG